MNHDVLSLIDAVLKSNTTATSCVLKGCNWLEAQAAANLVLQHPCAVRTITCANEIPIGDITGKTGQQLTELDLGRSALSAEDAAVLGVAFSRAPQQLQAIKLGAVAGNQPAAVAALIAGIQQLPNLRLLNGFDMGYVAGSARSSGVVDLSGRSLGPVAGSVLFSSLTRQQLLSSLTALNVTACGLGPAGVHSFMEAVSTTSPTGGGGCLSRLLVVCFADNGLGAEGVATLMQALAAGGAPLAALDLSANNMGDDGCKQLAPLLRQHQPTLTNLALASNGIGPDGMRALAPVLSAATSLSDLQLQGNHVGDAGLSVLCKALIQLPQLKSLQLQENYSIGAEGTRALAQLLSQSVNLQQLNLAKNSLGRWCTCARARGFMHVAIIRCRIV